MIRLTNVTLARGAKVLVEGLRRAGPNLTRAQLVCALESIEYLDLAPAFRKTWRRTHHRFGEHWNARGHRVVAEALGDRLRMDARRP